MKAMKEKSDKLGLALLYYMEEREADPRPSAERIAEIVNNGIRDLYNEYIV